MRAFLVCLALVAAASATSQQFELQGGQVTNTTYISQVAVQGGYAFGLSGSKVWIYSVPGSFHVHQEAYRHWSGRT